MLFWISGCLTIFYPNTTKGYNTPPWIMLLWFLGMGCIWGQAPLEDYFHYTVRDLWDSYHLEKYSSPTGLSLNYAQVNIPNPCFYYLISLMLI